MSTDFATTLGDPFSSLTTALQAFDPVTDADAWHRLHHGPAGPTASASCLDQLRATWNLSVDRLMESVRESLAKLNAANTPGSVCPHTYPSALRFIELLDPHLGLPAPASTAVEHTRFVCFVWGLLPDECPFRKAVNEDDCFHGPRDERLILLGPAVRLRDRVIPQDYYSINDAILLTRTLSARQRQVEEQARLDEEQAKAWAEAEQPLTQSPQQQKIAALEKRLADDRAALEGRILELELAQQLAAKPSPPPKKRASSPSTFPARYWQR